jgi:hypothetical protein
MRPAGSLFTAFAVGLSLLAASCGESSYEHQADAAYERAQRLTGEEQEFAQKQAYQLYLLAIKVHPDQVGMQLRSRFIEMSIARARMVMEENGLFADPLPFFIEDIDHYVTPALPDQVRQQYALFLAQLADSFAQRRIFTESIRYLDKAVGVAGAPAAVSLLRGQTVALAEKENRDRALTELAKGKAGNEDALVRAEYYAEAALSFDTASPEARALAAECRKLTIGILCDYRRALDTLSDTLLFRRLEKNTLFLAVPSCRVAGDVSMSVVFSNYSGGGINVSAGDFTLIDGAGRRYPALSPEKEIGVVDQYRMMHFTLSFPKPAGAIAKLIYQGGKRSAEKDFF